MLGSTVLALALVETALRGAALLAHRSEGSLEEIVARPRIPMSHEATLGDLIQPSSRPGIVYELKPRLPSVRFRGAPVSTNRWGFRGPEYARTPRKGVVRIVGIGDSVMFGWGVGREETYLSIIEDDLNARHPQRMWEVINTAVPGYNTYIEIETLKAKGMRFRPVLVILGLVHNDLQLPSFIRSEESVLTLRRLLLWDVLPGRLEDAPAGVDERGEWQFEDDPSRVPAQYRHMVGWQAFEKALDTLAGLRRRRGFEVIVVGRDRGKAGRMLAAARRRGFETVSTEARLAAYMGNHGIGDLRTSELVLHPRDPHPSARQHALIAQAILPIIERWIAGANGALAVGSSR